ERGDRLQRLDFTPAWPAVSLYLSAQARTNFAEGHSPGGVPWVGLKRPSRKRGGPSAKPLRDTGLLMASQGQGGAGHVEEASATAFVTGTNVAYAGYQQGGTQHSPARPFLGLTTLMADRVVLILQDHAAREALS